MNLQNDPNAWATAKFGIGQPVLRSEDPTLVRGEGRYTDDVSVPGQAYAVIVRSRHRARHHPPHRHRGGAQDARRARRLYRRRSRGRRLRHAQMHRAVQEPRRQRDEEAAAQRVADRQGALRRRSGRVRGGGDAAAGEGRGRGGRGRHRAAAGGHQSGAGGEAGRAGALRRGARQRGARLSLRRRRARWRRPSPRPRM